MKELIIKSYDGTEAMYNQLLRLRADVWLTPEEKAKLGMDLSGLGELQDLMISSPLFICQMGYLIESGLEILVTYALGYLMTSPKDLHAKPEVIISEQCHALDYLFERNGLPQNVFCYNGAGTHPDHRNKGYATQVIQAREVELFANVEKYNIGHAFLYTWEGSVPKESQKDMEMLEGIDLVDPKKIIGIRNLLWPRGN